MFEYKKDKYELMAEAEGENAFAEAIEVAATADNTKPDNEEEKK